MEFTMSIPVIVCLVLGVLFLIAEIFTPGIGVCGGIGVVLLIAAAVLQAKSFTEALIYIICVLVVAGAVMFFVLRSASKGRLSHSKIILKSSIEEKGHDYGALLYSSGIAATPLRPAGSVTIEGRLYDVVAESDFIDKGEPIEVSSVDGMRMVVRRAGESA